MTSTPEGNVKELRGVDAMLARIMEGLELPDGPTKASLEKNLRDQFGEEALKETMEKMMAIYPDEPVDIGDSWSKEVVLSMGMPMTINNAWTLAARKGGVATVEVRSQVKPNPGAAPLKMGPISISYEMSGEQTGSMELDEATGWLLRGKMTQKFSGVIKVEGSPQKPEGMSWPISVDSTVTLESVD